MTTIININEKFRLITDPLQWIIQEMPEATEKRTKAPQWKNVGYFTSLDSALQCLAHRQINAIEGEYNAEALAPLCAALDAITAGAMKAREAA